MPSRAVLFDDRILVAFMVGERLPISRNPERFTTSSFYFRACRAAVLGAAGHLSGPFHRLASDRRAAALENLLTLPDDVGLPDPRHLVPLMVQVQRRHPTLNVLNTEAVAAAILLKARMVLSAPTAQGQLADVVRHEDVAVQIVDLP